MEILHTDNLNMQQAKNFSPWLNKMCLIFSDLLAFFCAFLVAYWIMEGGESLSAELGSLSNGTGYARIISFGLIVFCGLIWFWAKLRHYTHRKPFWSELRECLQVICALGIADLAMVALSKWDLSRGQWGLLWSTSLVLVPLLRILTKLSLKRLGFWQWPSLIIGCGPNAQDAYMALCGEKLMGLEVVAFVSPDHQHCSSLVPDIPVLNSPMSEITRHYHKAKLFIAVEYEQSELRDNWLRYLTAKGLRNVSVIPTLRGVPLHGTDVSYFFSHELLLLRVHNNLARLSSRVVKRLFDIVASLCLLLLLSPLLLFISYKVTRDGGRPFYGHERVGQHGRRFNCMKFRSMIANSQEVLEKLLASDPQARAEWQKDFKLKADPRITPIGQFIRKTSLDELPQLWNVLKGEMSLVGPRPIVDEELARYGEDCEYYLMAKPGITGLWQVSGRNDIDYSTRVYLDGWYVKNWSLWYDIAILFKTIGVVLGRQGAY